MALEILGQLADLVTGIFISIRASKRKGPFPTISIVVTGMVFLLLAAVLSLFATTLAPGTPPFIVISTAFLCAAVAPFGAQKAGMRLGFLLTPIRAMILSFFAAVGAFGVLYVSNAL